MKEAFIRRARRGEPQAPPRWGDEERSVSKSHRRVRYPLASCRFPNTSNRAQRLSIFGGIAIGRLTGSSHPPPRPRNSLPSSSRRSYRETRRRKPSLVGGAARVIYREADRAPNLSNSRPVLR